MKFEIHAYSLVREEVQKCKNTLKLHKFKSSELIKYIEKRELEDSKRKLH